MPYVAARYFVGFDSTSKVRLREKVTDKAQLPIC
jgi:hypothetical protein